MVSMPSPTTPRSSTRNRVGIGAVAREAELPGAPPYRSGSVLYASQPVRRSTTEPAATRPLAASNAATWSRVRTQSGSAAPAALMSMTTAGRMSVAGSIWCSSAAPSTMWAGASKWVPVCSMNVTRRL